MLNRMHLVSFAAFTVLCALPGVSKADGSEGDSFFVPVAYVADEPSNVSCKQAKQAAWFLQQMEITDGDASPAAAPIDCQRETEILASTHEQAE